MATQLRQNFPHLAPAMWGIIHAPGWSASPSTYEPRRPDGVSASRRKPHRTSVLPASRPSDPTNIVIPRVAELWAAVTARRHDPPTPRLGVSTSAPREQPGQSRRPTTGEPGLGGHRWWWGGRLRAVERPPGGGSFGWAGLGGGGHDADADRCGVDLAAGGGPGLAAARGRRCVGVACPGAGGGDRGRDRARLLVARSDGDLQFGVRLGFRPLAGHPGGFCPRSAPSATRTTLSP